MDFQLNEDSLIPLYQQLMEDIKAALTEGKYATDEKIPSESELSELYHVSRITVRRAVEELCSEGYLVKKQGKGTYVSQPKVIRKITQDKDGHFKFVVAEGVNEEGPIFTFGDTNMRTRFTCGAREFVNRWSQAGPTHHMAAAAGRHIDTILKVAEIFNVPVDVITR